MTDGSDDDDDATYSWFFQVWLSQSWAEPSPQKSVRHRDANFGAYLLRKEKS